MFASNEVKALSRMLAAALSLPAAQLVHAQSMPESASVALKYLSYQDSQPGADRVRVIAPAVELVVPFAGAWSLGAGHVIDTISGASPAFHTEALSKLRDRRRASDVSLSHYGENLTLSAGASFSSESDYISRGINGGASLTSEDKNTTWSGGINLLHDTINPSNRAVIDERKNVADLSFSVTQVMTQRDLIQLILGYSRGIGYFTDPYKTFDNRPRERNHTTLAARWNHYIAASGGTARLAYRHYRDTFSIRAHTFTTEYVQPLPAGWSVTPLLRYYTQSAASFYIDRDPASSPLPTNPPDDAVYFTEEHRLSAYGALTVGLKLAWQIDPHWSVDLKAERYEQRASWTLSGNGSPHLAPFMAVSYQIGVKRRF